MKRCLADICYGTVPSKCFYAKKCNIQMHLGRSRKLYMTTRGKSFYFKGTESVTLINTSPLNLSCSIQYLYAMCRILEECHNVMVAKWRKINTRIFL
jgi:hypothetical protein